MDPATSPATAKTPFELVLLGPPALRDALGQTPGGLGAGKPLALLCFLCVRGEARRDEALALLWGDVDEARARNAFRQALHRLRLALGDDLVIGEGPVLRVALGDRLRADIRAFERAIDESRFDEALALYGGDFLLGFDVGAPAFALWAEGQRTRLRARCRSAAQQAVQLALVEGRLDVAERAIRKLLAVAPLDAEAVETAATAFVSLGRRGDAADVLQQFARGTEDELGAKLPDHLKAMLARVEQRRVGAPDGRAATDGDFVGRDRELASLLALWNILDDKTGAAVIVEGIDGAGKTRLVREFADGVRALGSAHVLHGAEGPSGHTAPYAAISAALRPLVQAAGVAGASPHLLAEAARLLPELRDTFQLPQVELVQEDAARLRMAEGIAALLEAAAYERRICLILEDVHRASTGSLELVGYLIQRLRQAPVLFALTFNPEKAPPEIRARLRALEAQRITLAPLPQLAAARSRWAAALARSFPHWRFLTGAAVASSAIAIAVTALRPRPAPTAFSTRDTLVVAKADEVRSGRVHLVTLDAGSGLTMSEPRARPVSNPAWADSIALPWVNPLASPNGRFVGVERVTPNGANVYVISADRRDTVPLVVGSQEGLGMGWSPDGEAFLATRRSRTNNGESHAALFAFSPRGRQSVPIDTSAEHAVVEAAWSPDGSRIAWVARVAGGNEEVFVAWADGTEALNVSQHSAQDDHVTWSPDGSLVAFTSRRDGNAEIYAYDLLSARLWRLTDDAAHDDRAAFAGDGRSVAFESTRGGAADVHLMPTLGGRGIRVGDSTSRYGIIGWRRSNSRYIDRLEIETPASARAGDTVVLRLRALDQLGSPLAIDDARWTVIDGEVIRTPHRDSATSGSERRFVALRDGLGRVAVTIGGWRFDTAGVKVGEGSIILLRDGFDGNGIGAAWHALGQPTPTATRGAGLSLNADREWESGVLSRATVPLRSGLSLRATLRAPFHIQTAATSASISLVAPEVSEDIDQVAPRFLRLIAMTWNADAGRFIYAAEREIFAEAVPAGKDSGARDVEILINADGTVSFLVDGVVRWRSTVRVLRLNRFTRAQVWLSGQDTGAQVLLNNVIVAIAGASR
jgi:DNA-binding SARP family transcriptional activator